MKEYQPVGGYGLTFPIQKVPGSNWIVIGEVWENDIHARRDGHDPRLLWVDIHYDGDDPTVSFYDPADFSRLPKSVVHDAQAMDRRDVRLRRARMTSYEISYWESLYQRKAIAEARIAIHRHSPWETGGVVVPQGGYVMKEGDPPNPIGRNEADWGLELVIKYLRLKREKDFTQSDALRREMTEAGPFMLFEHKDGMEYIFLPPHLRSCV